MTNSFNRSNKLNAKNHNARTLQIESLENRELLSVVSPFTNADNLTDYVSAFVSTPNPANTGFLTNLNQDIPLPPQYKAPQLAPAEGGLSVPLVQTAPTSLATNNPAPTLQIAETPLVVELDSPLAVQTTPTALAASSNTPSDLGETVAQSLNTTYLNLKIKSTSSSSVNVSWTDIGAKSYTVKYSLLDDNFNVVGQVTTKVVKGKTSLSISLKSDRLYYVQIIPQGMESFEESYYATPLSKLTVKVVNKTENSISFQIPGNYMWRHGSNCLVGIKAQNEKSYTYYDTFIDTANGQSGALSYSFQGDVLTIKGLSANTNYSFQFAQAYNTSRLSLISPYTSVSASTTTVKSSKIVVNTLDDTVNNDSYTSLREAILRATDGSVITFASNLKGKTINMRSSLDIANKSITIDASSLYDAQFNQPGLKLNRISANSEDANIIFNINHSKNVTIKGIIFTGSSGCGIVCTDANAAGTSYTTSVINIQNCSFLNLGYGCLTALGNKNSIVNINSCIFRNISDVAVWNLSSEGKIIISKCKMSYCDSNTLCNYSSQMYVSDSEFTDNALVTVNFGQIEFKRCKFLYNTGYIIYNSGDSTNNATASFSEVLVAHNQLEFSDDACFENDSYSSINIYYMTSAHNSKTFKNNGSTYSLTVYNSVCSTKNYGSSPISQFNCITFTNSGLGDDYRPTYDSPCVDAGWSSSYWAEKDLAGNQRLMGDAVDIGCYEYFPVETRSKTSGKTTIYWANAGVSSYTVQYRIDGTDNWTTKTVKNKTELTISVKNNTLYEVLVTPEGSQRNEKNIILTGALAKIGVKTQNKTRNSVTFQLSNLIPEPTFRIGIKKPTDKEFVYYDVIGYNGKIGPYSFTSNYYNNDSGVGQSTFTISGLSSNSRYEFQFAQIEDLSQTVLYSPAYAISTITQVSVTTSR